MSGTRRSRARPTPERTQAQALAEALNGRGLGAAVAHGRTHQEHPCVLVAPRPGQPTAEYVYAAPEAGRWWFWWSDLEPVAPISEVSAAAEMIARAVELGRRAADEAIRL